MKEYRDIVFKHLEQEGHNLLLDIFVPEGDPQPLIMWIHGGGWQYLGKGWNLVEKQVERGYAVASIEYRYADEAPFPANVLDVKDAMFFLKEHAKEYGYDASRFIVSGDSAGAHLASLVALTQGKADWNPEGRDDSVQAAVLYAGMYDMNLGYNPDHTEVFDTYLGVPIQSKEGMAAAAVASPITYLDASAPPMLLLYGSADTTVPVVQPRNFRDKLEALGVPVHCYHVPGGHHGLRYGVCDAIVQEFLDWYIKDELTVDIPHAQPHEERTLPRKDGKSILNP